MSKNHNKAQQNFQALHNDDTVSKPRTIATIAVSLTGNAIWEKSERVEASYILIKLLINN